ncbi:hypothetical protein VR010_04940 [Actinomycetaceae bacterium L2_0104]
MSEARSNESPEVAVCEEFPGPSTARFTKALVWEQLHRKSTSVLMVLSLLIVLPYCYVMLYMYYLAGVDEPHLLYEMNYTITLSVADTVFFSFILLAAPVIVALTGGKYSRGVAATQHVTVGNRKVYLAAHCVAAFSFVMAWSFVAVIVAWTVARVTVGDFSNDISLFELWLRVIGPLLLLTSMCVGFSFMLRSTFVTLALWYLLMSVFGPMLLLMSSGDRTVGVWMAWFIPSPTWTAFWGDVEVAPDMAALGATPFGQAWAVLAVWATVLTAVGTWRTIRTDVKA